MASARNEAPKAPRQRGWSVRRKCPPPHLETGVGRWLCLLPRNVFRFLSSNGKFWCILEANFIAVELSVLQA